MRAGRLRNNVDMLSDKEGAVTTIDEKTGGVRARWPSGKKRMAPALLEWCVEPWWVVDMLFAAQTFRSTIYDPCCGAGTIPEVARRHGYRTIATDIADRGYPRQDRRLDFTADAAVRAFTRNCGADVVFNAPYQRGRLAVAFIDQALRVTGGRVAALVNDAFLSSAGRWDAAAGVYVGGRHDKFVDEWPVSAIYHCSTRPSIPPGGFDIIPEGGSANYVWLIFDLDFKGDPLTRWLRREGGSRNGAVA